jgi:hypothetical protein
MSIENARHLRDINDFVATMNFLDMNDPDDIAIINNKDHVVCP